MARICISFTCCLNFFTLQCSFVSWCSHKPIIYLNVISIWIYFRYYLKWMQGNFIAENISKLSIQFSGANCFFFDEMVNCLKVIRLHFNTIIIIFSSNSTQKDLNSNFFTKPKTIISALGGRFTLEENSVYWWKNRESFERYNVLSTLMAEKIHEK